MPSDRTPSPCRPGTRAPVRTCPSRRTARAPWWRTACALIEHAAVARISPGWAAAMRRAARLTVSPMTVNARRYSVPMSPAKTCPAVHADPDRERMGRLGHAACGPQEASLVVLERHRDAGGEDDLPPVGVDVRGQERDGLEAAPRPGPSTPWSSNAAAPGPVRPRPAGRRRPENLMKATLANRCSDSPPGSPSRPRSATGTDLDGGGVTGRAGSARAPVAPRGANAGGDPPPLAAPTAPPAVGLPCPR